ncbi:DUF411 domain-containing protein [Thalassobaculum sp.]|jgi:hypothetical protein|uniref:DUF411 domain-containing protein n=1 Tax=Thalassobaculum sp. TaxID=2022740 RepID=UPI0032EFEE77
MLRLIALLGLLMLPLSPAHAADPAKTATLYKNPQCGCCEAYADYLRENGYEVTVVPTHDLQLIKQEQGVPEHFEGCHTTLIDNYVVEGHVPVKTLNRLLTERPAIKGISLPGMPMGSPGMNGQKAGPFQIYEIAEGAPKIYAVE